MIMATLACPPEFTAEDDGYSGISGETLQKAMDELKEDPSTRATMVRDLRDRILVKETELKVSSDQLFTSLANCKVQTKPLFLL